MDDVADSVDDMNEEIDDGVDLSYKFYWKLGFEVC